MSKPSRCSHAWARPTAHTSESGARGFSDMPLRNFCGAHMETSCSVRLSLTATRVLGQERKSLQLDSKWTGCQPHREARVKRQGLCTEVSFQHLRKVQSSGLASNSHTCQLVLLVLPFSALGQWLLGGVWTPVCEAADVALPVPSSY